MVTKIVELEGEVISFVIINCSKQRIIIVIRLWFFLFTSTIEMMFFSKDIVLISSDIIRNYNIE